MTLGTVAFAENYDHLEVEQRLRTSWDRLKLYEFDPNSGKPVYSIDTPPPYVSAAHLHVGHAMSYAQAEFVVRYRRMRGYSSYYPMGFDDNGLPTERYVERTYKINKNNTTRSEFRHICSEETAKGAAVTRKSARAWTSAICGSVTRRSMRTRAPSQSPSWISSRRAWCSNRRTVIWNADETAWRADLETLQRSRRWTT